MKNLLFLSLIFILTLVACDNTRKGMEKDAAEWSAEMQENFQSLESDMKTWNNKLENEINEIDKKLENADDDVAAELKEQREELEEMRKNLAAKMDDAKNSAKKNWDEFKKETESFFTNIENSLDYEIEIKKEG